MSSGRSLYTTAGPVVMREVSLAALQLSQIVVWRARSAVIGT